jgi:hypothetical protein
VVSLSTVVNSSSLTGRFFLSIVSTMECGGR